MDLDPNYDPSDFLPTGSRHINTSGDDKDLAGPSNNQNLASTNIQDDLEISDSDEEMARDSPQDDSLDIKTEGDLGELWF